MVTMVRIEGQQDIDSMRGGDERVEWEEEGESVHEVGDDGRNDGKGEKNVIFKQGGESDDLRKKKFMEVIIFF